MKKLKWRLFEDARKWAINHKLIKKSDWIDLCKQADFPKDIPKTPQSVYCEWIGWKDFTGVDWHKECLPYERARLIALGLKTSQYGYLDMVKSGKLPVG